MGFPFVKFQRSLSSIGGEWRGGGLIAAPKCS
jgi:hypothetical protein